MPANDAAWGVGALLYSEPTEPLLDPVTEPVVANLIRAAMQFEVATNPGGRLRRAGILGEVAEHTIARLLTARLRAKASASAWDAWSKDFGRIQIRARMPEQTDGRSRFHRIITLRGDYDHLAVALFDDWYKPWIVHVLTVAEAQALYRGSHQPRIPIASAFRVGLRIVGDAVGWPPT